MTNAATATAVIDRFLACRAASVAASTYERDAEAIGWFRAFADARELPALDEFTAYRLSRETGRAPSEYELDAVLTLVEGVSEFFSTWLPEAISASRVQTSMAAIVVRIFGRWLFERDLVDEDVADSLARFTKLYDHAPPTRPAIAIVADL